MKLKKILLKLTLLFTLHQVYPSLPSPNNSWLNTLYTSTAPYATKLGAFLKPLLPSFFDNYSAEQVGYSAFGLGLGTATLCGLGYYCMYKNVHPEFNNQAHPEFKKLQAHPEFKDLNEFLKDSIEKLNKNNGTLNIAITFKKKPKAITHIVTFQDPYIVQWDITRLYESTNGGVFKDTKIINFDGFSKAIFEQILNNFEAQGLNLKNQASHISIIKTYDQ